VTHVVEIIRQLDVGPGDVIVCLPGLLIFTVWLNRTSFGRLALEDSRPRRNSMAAYLPFIPMVIWMGTIAVGVFSKEILLSGLSDFESSFIDQLLLCVGAAAGIAAIVVPVRRHFAGRLKGFGLWAKNAPRDLGIAIVNLTAIYPLVAIALLATLFFGKLFGGSEFELAKHDELILLSKQSQISLRVLIVLVATVVTPIFEEMLFRGMFQSMIRSYLSELRFWRVGWGNRQFGWVAIVLSSGLFATVHANAGHWPGLFVLAMCLGYSYEKSGSLLRPIFIHAMFNAISVIFTLVGA